MSPTTPSASAAPSAPKSSARPWCARSSCLGFPCPTGCRRDKQVRKQKAEGRRQKCSAYADGPSVLPQQPIVYAAHFLLSAFCLENSFSSFATITLSRTGTPPEESECH